MSLGDPGVDREAEGAALACMVLEPKCIPEVLEQVTVESFVFQEHRVVFEAIAAIWRRNPQGELDIVLLRGELVSTGVLQTDEATAVLQRLLSAVPAPAHAVYYAKRVADRERFRKACAAVEQMRELLSSGGDADSLIQRIQELALGLECRARERNIFHVVKHATAIAVATQDAPVVVPTGFPDLDAKIRGVEPGGLVYVAARPSMGKTAVGCCWALNAAHKGKRVLFFTLEMSARSVIERMAAMLGCVSLAVIKGGTPPQAMLERFYAGSVELQKLPITVVENTATVEQIQAVLRQLKQAGPVDLTFIDYVGLMSVSQGRKQNRCEQLSEISRSLKLMAQTEHVPLVVLSQLNRECEARDNHQPRLSDLRDSGSLEQDADVVLLLHREDYYRRMKDPGTSKIDGLAEVLVAKNRNGPTGLATLVYIEEEMRFANRI